MDAAYMASPCGDTRPNTFSPGEKFTALTRLYYEWAAYLQPSETVLLGWLLANTVARDNKTGWYSLNHLVKGVRKRGADNTWTGGTGLSRRTLQRVITSLEQRGAIETRISARGTYFTVVLTWDPATGQAGGSNVVPLRTRHAGQKMHLHEDDAY